jgi:hypothetical protein
VGNICFFFEFILHSAYTVDARALTSILSPLSLIDIMYCTGDTKATPASILRFIWISCLHNVVKRVLIELKNYFVFSVVHTFMEFEGIR